ncbi:MAG TPA: amidohydrolase family protein, partial [Woeseiaceae bacterium]
MSSRREPATQSACVVFLSALLFVAGCSSEKDEYATLVVTDARIWTGDKDRPWAAALAVRGDTIAAIGGRTDIEPWIGPETEVIAVPDSMLVPGMIDTHVHFITGGSGLASVQLRDAGAPEEFTQRIADFAASIEPGEWILYGTWDHENWGGELPTRD